MTLFVDRMVKLIRINAPWKQRLVKGVILILKFLLKGNVEVLEVSDAWENYFHDFVSYTYYAWCCYHSRWLRFIFMIPGNSCSGKPCGEPCKLLNIEVGVCDGRGQCRHLMENPCTVHGCDGKQFGEVCLMGDILGWCGAGGRCEPTQESG